MIQNTIISAPRLCRLHGLQVVSPQSSPTALKALQLPQRSRMSGGENLAGTAFSPYDTGHWFSCFGGHSCSVFPNRTDRIDLKFTPSPPIAWRIHRPTQVLVGVASVVVAWCGHRRSQPSGAAIPPVRAMPLPPRCLRAGAVHGAWCGWAVLRQNYNYRQCMEQSRKWNF